MGKLLLWAIVILAALIVMRLLAQHSAHKTARRRHADQNPGKPGSAATEAMVRCAWCGVHLPRSEAILQHGQLWCCEEHARLGQGGNA